MEGKIQRYPLDIWVVRHRAAELVEVQNASNVPCRHTVFENNSKKSYFQIRKFRFSLCQKST